MYACCRLLLQQMMQLLVITWPYVIDLKYSIKIHKDKIIDKQVYP